MILEDEIDTPKMNDLNYNNTMNKEKLGDILTAIWLIVIIAGIFALGAIYGAFSIGQKITTDKPITPSITISTVNNNGIIKADTIYTYNK